MAAAVLHRRRSPVVRLVQQQLPVIRLQMVAATSANPLVVMLQIVIAAAGKMTNTTASKAQGATVLLLWSRGSAGNEGRVPAEGDRFQPGNGQFDCDKAYRYDDDRFH